MNIQLSPHSHIHDALNFFEALKKQEEENTTNQNRLSLIKKKLGKKKQEKKTPSPKLKKQKRNQLFALQMHLLFFVIIYLYPAFVFLLFILL